MGACDTMIGESNFHKKNKTTPNKKFFTESTRDISQDFYLKSSRDLFHFKPSMISKNIEDFTYILPEKLAKRDDVSKFYSLSSRPKAKGTYGEVYIAEDQKGNKYAIKKILKRKIPSNKAIIQEAEISLKLKHKNIIKVYEIYEDYNYISYVMEMGEIDLFDYMYNDKSYLIPEKLIVEILIQLFEVIDYLHNEEKIIHCDIKPENFMINYDKNNQPILKLIDFGMAVYKPKNEVERLHNFKGTREYSAPETFEGKFNEKVDEWALGVIMYTFLTGKDLFLGETPAEIRDNIKFSEINFDLIKDIELRELNKKLLDRYVAKRICVNQAIGIIKNIYYSRSKNGTFNSDNITEAKGIFNDNMRDISSRMQFLHVY